MSRRQREPSDPAEFDANQRQGVDIPAPPVTYEKSPEVTKNRNVTDPFYLGKKNSGLLRVESGRSRRVHRRETRTEIETAPFAPDKYRKMILTSVAGRV